MFSFPPLTPFVKKLMIVLGASYVLELILQNFLHVPVMTLLALNPAELGPLTPLQMVTYVLVPDRDPVWMLIELVFLWLILSPFEASFGPRRALVLSLWGIVGTALAVVLCAQLLPSTAHLYVGAGCISLAGIAAVTQMMRGGKMLFFGVLPMTPQHMLLLIVGLSVVSFLASKDFLSLVATLASLGSGLAYVRYLRRPPPRMRGKRSSGARFRVLRGGADRDGDGDHPKWLN